VTEDDYVQYVAVFFHFKDWPENYVDLKDYFSVQL